MFDTSRALADMASQIRSCRSAAGLTLQQLATRSGVAASTIHKVEGRQMVPTVAVLLKIARGLGCRPEELIRDGLDDAASAPPAAENTSSGNGGLRASALPPSAHRKLNVWKLALSKSQSLPDLAPGPGQRILLLVDQGIVEVEAGSKYLTLSAGECIEIEGAPLRAKTSTAGPVRLTLVASDSEAIAAELAVASTV